MYWSLYRLHKPMRLRLLHINRHMLVSSTTPILPPASTLFLLLSCCISYNYFWTMMTLIITRVKCYMSPALVLLDIFSWQLLTALNLSVKVMTSLPSRNENKPIILLLILTPTTLLLKKNHLFTHFCILRTDSSISNGFLRGPPTISLYTGTIEA